VNRLDRFLSEAGELVPAAILCVFFPLYLGYEGFTFLKFLLYVVVSSVLLTIVDVLTRRLRDWEAMGLAANTGFWAGFVLSLGGICFGLASLIGPD
jgi:hypothetical protein